MKIIIKDIGYNRGYVIGPYLQERPGVNADIILEEGEDQEKCALKAMHYLKSITDKFHVEANPHLFESGERPTGRPERMQPIEINIQHERLWVSIENAETLEELTQIKEANPVMPFKILTFYNSRVDELTNKSDKNFTNGLE